MTKSLPDVPNSFHNQRVDDDPGIGIEIAEALAVQRLECLAHCVGWGSRHFESRVAAGEAKAGAVAELDAAGGNSLCLERSGDSLLPAARCASD